MPVDIRIGYPFGGRGIDHTASAGINADMIDCPVKIGVEKYEIPFLQAG